MNVEILGQEIGTGFSAPDLTGANTDWSELGTLDLGQVHIVRDLAEHTADSFVVFGEAVQPDTWVVKAIPDLHKGFPLKYMPVVELSNLAVPEHIFAIKVTPALAMDMERGKALTGVARELHRGGVFHNQVIELDADPSLTSPAQTVMVPVLRLHCPKQPGCQASEEYAVQRGTEVDVALSLAAVGGGAGTSTNLRCSSEWETAEGECLQYLLPAEIFTEYGTLVFNGKPVNYTGLLSRPVIRFIEGEHRQDAIPPTDDGCQQPAGAIHRDRHLMNPERISAGKRIHRFNAVSTVRGMLNLGLAPPGWPSFTFKYERTVTTTFTRSFTLVPNATYLAYTADPPADPARPEHSEILWTTL